MSDLPKFEPLPNVGNVVSNRVTSFNQGYNLYQCINYLQGYVSIVYENMDALLDDWNNFQTVVNENINNIATEETQRILNQWLSDGTLNDLISQNPLWNQKLDISGGTMTGNIKFSENTKIVGTTPGGNDIDLIHNTNDGASGNYVQFGDPDAKSVFNSSTRPIWHDGSDDFILLTSSDIANNLTTTDNTKALSATQGKNLQDTKLNKSDVKNTLTSTSTTQALSAAMGKQLEDNKLDVEDVINNLTSSTTTKALSAAQGKALNERIDNIQFTELIASQTNDWVDISVNINDYDAYLLLSTNSSYANMLGSLLVPFHSITLNNEMSAFYPADTINYECKFKFTSNSNAQIWTKSQYDGAVLYGLKLGGKA